MEHADMSETLTIRAVETSDLPAIADLWCELQRAHEAYHPCWTLTEFARDHYLDHLHSVIDSDSSVFRVVLESSGRVVGCCHGRVSSQPAHHSEHQIGEIISIIVDSSARDGGIGTALLTAVVEELQRSGVSRIETHVSADNADAIRFMERARFHLHNVMLSRDL
jgi:ribosomal protein S18 acetylase RimI-like enzyme